MVFKQRLGAPKLFLKKQVVLSANAYNYSDESLFLKLAY